MSRSTKRAWRASSTTLTWAGSGSGAAIRAQSASTAFGECSTLRISKTPSLGLPSATRWNSSDQSIPTASTGPPSSCKSERTRRWRRAAVLMDQSSRDDTLVGIGSPGAAPAGAVSSQSSRDKHRKRSAGGSSMEGEGRAIRHDLTLAFELADAADAISLAHFRTGLAVERKPDLTPVTEADRAVESELRRLLSHARPSDAVLGEEHGASGGSARRWILDPIDGTRNYARGIPVWATLVALEESGVVHLGLVSAPALGQRWWAERGEGAYAHGERIGVSSVSRVEDAVLCFAFEEELPAI